MRWAAALVLTVSLGWVCDLSAQQFPQKPLRLVVPYAAGGLTDRLARMIAEPLGRDLKQQVVVENRGGAGGRLAAQAVASAPPDGYTLLLTVPGLAPAGWTRIGRVARAPLVLVAGSAAPKSMSEVIAATKSPLKKPVVAVVGEGTAGHYAFELLNAALNSGFERGPYNDTNAAISAVVSGHAAMTFVEPSAAMSAAHTDKLRPLAVTSKARSPHLSGVPTMEELGIRGFVIDAWVGIVAPEGISDQITSRLADGLRRATDDPALKAPLREMGWEAGYLPPSDFQSFVLSEYQVPIHVLTPPTCCATKTCQDMRICQSNALR